MENLYVEQMVETNDRQPSSTHAGRGHRFAAPHAGALGRRPQEKEAEIERRAATNEVRGLSGQGGAVSAWGSVGGTPRQRQAAEALVPGLCSGPPGGGFRWPSEKGAKLAKKLGQPQPFLAVFVQ